MRYPLPEPEKDKWLKARKVSEPIPRAACPSQTGQPGSALSPATAPVVLQAGLWLQQPHQPCLHPCQPRWGGTIPKPRTELRKRPRAQPQLLRRARENPQRAIREKSGHGFKEILRTWSLWNQKHGLHCSHLKAGFRKTFVLNSLINVSYFMLFSCFLSNVSCPGSASPAYHAGGVTG